MSANKSERKRGRIGRIGLIALCLVLVAIAISFSQLESAKERVVDTKQGQIKNCRLEIGLIRSHYIGRTFIQPGQANREIGVKINFNTVKGVLE